MSSPLLNPGQQKPQVVDWARLIPGESPVFRGSPKKPVQSVRPYASVKAAEIPFVAAWAPPHSKESLVPGFLQDRMAWKLASATAVDFALVVVNWFLIGALLVPLRGLFPRVRLFEYAAGAPVSLLGIAFLHAALITSMGYRHRLGDRRRQAWVLGKSVLGATAVLCLTSGLQGASRATSALFCGAGLLHYGTLLCWRWLRARQDRWRQPGEMRNVLIVGAGGVGRRVASYAEEHPEAGRMVFGFLDNERPLGNGVIGRVCDLARMARTGFVDEVILAAPHDRDLIQQVLRESRRLRLDLEIVPEMFGCKPTGREVERAGDLLVISLHAERLPSAGLILKRLSDLIGAGMAIAILSPVLAVIAGLIKLDSPGPVLYSAQRAGRKGQRFRCYKFRTMVNDADALKESLRTSNQRSGPFFKIADDPRITRLGRFLRQYSLDELPQFWNVLKGDMSLVGPRPHPLDDVAAYEIEHLARLDVMPGMTGLWQVTARGDPSFQRNMELDREYIRTWSLGSDMRILLRTFLVVARGSGD